MDTFFNLSSLTLIFISILISFYGIFIWKYSLPKYKILIVFFIYLTTNSILTTILSRYGIYTIIYINLYSILEYFLLGYFILLTIKDVKNFKVIRIVYVFFLGTLIFSFLKDSNITTQFNSYIASMDMLILMGLSLVLFYKILNELEYKTIYNNPLFWIASGILIYTSGNLFTFILESSLREERLIYYIVVNFNLYIITLFLGIGFWKIKQTSNK